MDGNDLSSFTGGEGSIIFGGDTGTAISSRVMRRKEMLGAAWLRCLSSLLIEFRRMVEFGAISGFQ